MKSYVEPGYKPAGQSEGVERGVRPAVNYGKSYAQFALFLRDIKSGKDSVIYGQDYVVVSRKKFDEINAALKDKQA